MSAADRICAARLTALSAWTRHYWRDTLRERKNVLEGPAAANAAQDDDEGDE